MKTVSKYCIWCIQILKDCETVHENLIQNIQATSKLLSIKNKERHFRHQKKKKNNNTYRLKKKIFRWASDFSTATMF